MSDAASAPKKGTSDPFKGQRQRNDMAVTDAQKKSPSVTITLTRYAEPDWLLNQTLTSLAEQEGVTGEVLLLDQAPSEETLDFVTTLSTTGLGFRYEEISPGGLSRARNIGLQRAKYDSVLYIDSDAVAAPDWAARLAVTLSGDSVGIAGGRILPRWHGTPPWLARAPFVRDQYSMLDLGTDVRPVSRIVGANFGVRRDRLGDSASFDEKLGRRDGQLFGGEETDLCRRALEDGWKVLYDGAAVVEHQVLPERLSYAWILRRFYYAGLGRATLGGTPNPSKKLSTRDYPALCAILPAYGLGFLRGRVQRARIKTNE